MLQYYNYHGTLTKFVIQIDTDFYDISKYSIDSNYLILYMNEELDITNGFVLKETHGSDSVWELNIKKYKNKNKIIRVISE